MNRNDPRPIAVLGATGYVGARLVPRLVKAGWRVRAVGRNPDKLAGRPWAADPGVEIAPGDVLDRGSLEAALRGCRAVFYLVHSMGPHIADFAATDRQAAENLAAAAAAAGVERIIYLGGLGDDAPHLSHHLRSRHEVGDILKKGSIPVTIFRAAMIIGSGSASFEILRYLVERLPVMVTPRWIDTPCQPIAVSNVLHYLVSCLDSPATIGETFDIGTEEVVTYRQLMRLYAEEARLPRRWIIPVPVLTPRLSSYWIHLVTPVPASLARPLAEGLRNPVLCRDAAIRELIPQLLFGCRMAIRLALENLRLQQVESSWMDAGRLPPVEWSSRDDPEWAGGTLFRDERRIVVAAPARQCWPAVVGIGGQTGWYYADWLWRLRGGMDRLLGGPGLGRGRRDPAAVRAGDALDFWRVLAAEPDRRLKLVAEMKLPGEAVLELRLTECADGTTEIRQSARFRPRGLFGLLYWYAVLPLHELVFAGMLRGIARAAGGAILVGPERPRDRTVRS
ncbi:MAG: SDR family oxidoreductase [Deltaproteobacteria bacterium]|nr:MAG: SDR family oxidoreductase [Deltaproteobacteria bacterium]